MPDDSVATWTCTTCADAAQPGRVIALLGNGLACADVDGSQADISIDLVDAAVGDVVLIHAGVAIGALR